MSAIRLLLHICCAAYCLSTLDLMLQISLFGGPTCSAPRNYLRLVGPVSRTTSWPPFDVPLRRSSTWTELRWFRPVPASFKLLLGWKPFTMWLWWNACENEKFDQLKQIEQYSLSLWACFIHKFNKVSFWQCKSNLDLFDFFSLNSLAWIMIYVLKHTQKSCN